MDAPALGEVRSYDDLVAVLGARIVQLNLTYELLDEIAGLTLRHSSKLFGPNPPRHLGIMSFGAILGALGVKLIAVVDDEQMARIKSRLVEHRGSGPSSHWRRKARRRVLLSVESQTAIRN